MISEFGGRQSWNAHAKSRAAAALCLMSPGIPMIWQGEEFAQDGWFDDNYDHAVEWPYERDTDGSRMKNLYQDATKTRWDHEALRRGSLAWTHEDHNNKVLAFRRDWAEQHVLVAVDFGSQNFGNHSYGVPVGYGRAVDADTLQPGYPVWWLGRCWQRVLRTSHPRRWQDLYQPP